MSAPVRIVLVEDDASIALGIKMTLEGEGYEVKIAEDGAQGLELARQGCDLIVLDVMMPRMNGFELLMALRNENIRIPALVLSARGSEVDKVMGLELGAEDYITKPFSVAEFMARVRVVLRRHKQSASAPEAPAGRNWKFGDIEVDERTREVRKAGQLVEVTTREFDLLVALLNVRGRVLSRQQIFDIVWGVNHHGTLRTIDNFVAQLRSKLENDPTSPEFLVTVRGVGYRLVEK